MTPNVFRRVYWRPAGSGKANMVNRPFGTKALITERGLQQLPWSLLRAYTLALNRARTR